jgi:hypothetical protein
MPLCERPLHGGPPSILLGFARGLLGGPPGILLSFALGLGGQPRILARLHCVVASLVGLQPRLSSVLLSRALSLLGPIERGRPRLCAAACGGEKCREEGCSRYDLHCRLLQDESRRFGARRN